MKGDTNLTRVLLAAVAIASVGGACTFGSDDARSAPPEKERIERSCAANARVVAGLDEIVISTNALQTDEPDPAEVTGALPKIQADYDELVAPAVTELQADPPSELRAEIERLVGQLQRFRDAGDTALLEPDATSTIDAFYYENCSTTRSEIDATEYAFGGSTTFVPGVVRFKLVNNGSELHHMVLFRRTSGTTESLDQLLVLPEVEMSEKLAAVAGSGPVRPGSSTYVTGTLERGDYAMVCFVSEGSTPERVEGGAPVFGESAPPHFALGMKRELTVG